MLNDNRDLRYYAMPNCFRCSCQSSGMPVTSFAKVSVSGAVPLNIAVTMSGARLTSESVLATTERSIFTALASSKTVLNFLGGVLIP